MRTNFEKLAMTLGSFLLILATLTTTANASCGDKTGPVFHRQSWDLGLFNAGSLLLTSSNADAVVGMWHVTFTAQGNQGGPPDGTPIDNALVTWHSDGTEVMNSGRPAQDGQFCMGVWKRTGVLKYKLNHIAWAGNDTANAPTGIGNPAGPTRFVEEVTLSPDGNHYTGTFTLDAYDTSGNVVAHIVGLLAGTRITVDTTVGDLL
jgi:hypothetical protein